MKREKGESLTLRYHVCVHAGRREQAKYHVKRPATQLMRALLSMSKATAIHP